jgi:membrane associated rhomboid family serine protease
MKLFGKKKKHIADSADRSSSTNVDMTNPTRSSFDANDHRAFSPIEPNLKQNQQEGAYMLHRAETGNNTSLNTNSTSEAISEYSLMEIDGKPIYIVKQARGYLSVLFSLVQLGILVTMMVQCGVAPMKMNPMIGPYPDALSYWGGKNSYEILYDGEYWRLVSPILLHAGVIHLVCNVAVQLDVGAFFEKEWGSFVWLIVYLSSAISGTILSVIVSPNTIGVGSSGSVCGLFGAKLAESLCRAKESTKRPDRQLSHSILCEQFGSTLCSVILILVFSFIPFVDWAAHVGGLLGGFVVGILLFSWGIKTPRYRYGMFFFGLITTAALYGTASLHMVNESKNQVAEEIADVCQYYQQFYDDYECRCQMK